MWKWFEKVTQGKQTIDGDANTALYAGRDITITHIHQNLSSNSSMLETKASRVFNVPVLRNPFFTGRNDFLVKLHEAIHKQKGIVRKPIQKTFALSGLGGVGKTQVAAEYAYRYQTEYTAVLWVSAENTELLQTSFGQLAPLLGFKNEKLNEQILAVQSWLRENQAWLLIFDNAETLALLNAAKSLLPVTANGEILFTTRAQATGTISNIEVSCFDEETGATLLLRRSKRVNLHLDEVEEIRNQLTESEWCTVTTLTHELGGLALAIDQAGAYIEQTDCGIAGYLERFRNCSSALLKERGFVSSSEHPEAVYKTFLLAWHKAKDRNHLIDEILYMSAFLHPDGIPEELFSNYDPLQLDIALATLKDYSLIQRIIETQMFTVHRLVQVVIKDVCN